MEIKNANLGVGYYLVESDSSGYFTVRDFIPHVQYIMEAAADGYVSYTSQGRISPGVHDIYLDPEAVLSGTVTDSSGRPLAGVELKLDSSGYSRYGRMKPLFYTTGPDGKYRFTKLVQGSYVTGFSKSGYIPETLRIQRLKEGEVFRLPMKLYRPASISGRITIRGLDSPARAVDVVAKGRSNHSASTYQDGTYRLEEMKPGEYEIYVQHQGFYNPEKRRISLSEGEQKKGMDYIVEAKRPEVQVYSHRYTFAREITWNSTCGPSGWRP